MITAVDSSVLLDVLCGDAKFGPGSADALRNAMRVGKLIVCECVLAEIAPTLTVGQFEDFMADWRLEFVPASLASVRLAGSQYSLFLRRGGKVDRVLPDFLIGAHAQTHADCLLSRDRGYFRDYFRRLRVVCPG